MVFRVLDLGRIHRAAHEDRLVTEPDRELRAGRDALAQASAFDQEADRRCDRDDRGEANEPEPGERERVTLPVGLDGADVGRGSEGDGDRDHTHEPDGAEQEVAKRRGRERRREVRADGKRAIETQWLRCGRFGVGHSSPSGGRIILIGRTPRG